MAGSGRRSAGRGPAQGRSRRYQSVAQLRDSSIGDHAQCHRSRRVADVLLTLVPLLVAIVVTLELCVALDLPLNFADIIALPLLLGVGVAFKIYYIMAWRNGKTALVQSTLTRAVIFSAMTQAAAFGSLWLSSDPGTSSMGKLMALALLCTMAAAVLFQPALMGRPRARSVPSESELDVEPQVELVAVRHKVEQPTHEAVDR